MQYQSIKNIKSIGKKKTLDFQVDHKDHNFYAEGIVVSNSHSVAYAILSAISVYCKFNYPQEFFFQALRMSQKKQKPFEEIAAIYVELPYFGIDLLPPDLVTSTMDFQLEGKNIRYGLSAIKGVAAKAIEKLQYFLDKEKTNKFQVFHASKETGLNIAVLAALIQSGCLKSLGEDRPRMVLEAQIWSKLTDRERNYCLASGPQYKYDLIVALQDYLNWNDGKPFKESRLQTIRKHTKPYLEIWKLNDRFPDFASYMYEKALLGYSYTTSLQKVFEKEHPNLQTCDQIKNQVDKGESVSIVATVLESKKFKSKKGNDCLKLTLLDHTGTLTAIITGDACARFVANNPIPKEDEIVHVQGDKNDDGIWMQKCTVENYRIYFKVNDLKKLEKESLAKETGGE